MRMSSERVERLRRPWVAGGILAAVAVLAFLAGTCAGGNGTSSSRSDGEGSPSHAHGGGASMEGGADQAQVWTCSMHPQIRRDEPGDCPICGMDLIPAATADDSSGAPPGRVTLSERARTLARIRTTEVRRGDQAPRISRPLVGRLAPDEAAMRAVTAWTGGRLDALLVDVTGARVRRGQAVARIYSPEIYAAHRELLAARARADRLPEGQSADALEAVRRRLALLGVPAAEIERMERADAPARNVPIRSPYGGTVRRRLATEGAYVDTGMPLYELADLTRLWVELDAYERDLPLLSVGDSVALEVQARPGVPYDGRIAFIEPTVDLDTRAVQVRVEVANDEGDLRPGMFVEATVTGAAVGGEGGAPAPLMIPSSAPLFTGRRSVVYVEVPGTGAPTYEMRVVRLGPETAAGFSVVAGLGEGERVVTHGAFVLDADLQIRSGVGMMALPDDGAGGGPWDAVVEVSEDVRAALVPVVDAYLAIAEASSRDDLEAARRGADQLDAARGDVPRPASEAARERWGRIDAALARHGAEVGSAGDLAAVRRGIDGLSDGLVDLLRSFGNPMSFPLHLAHCPMAFDDAGADWVQRGVDVENAYIGEEMLTCGEIRARVAPGQRLPGAPPAGVPPAEVGTAPTGGDAHAH